MPRLPITCGWRVSPIGSADRRQSRTTRRSRTREPSNEGLYQNGRGHNHDRGRGRNGAGRFEEKRQGGSLALGPEWEKSEAERLPGPTRSTEFLGNLVRSVQGRN